MKKSAFIILTLLTLTGCGESFDAAYDAFRSPLNSIPSVSVDTLSGWQTSPLNVTGSASDSDNDPLTYSWSEVTSYGVTFSTPASYETSVAFTGNDNGDVAVHAVIRLTVSDGEDESYCDMTLQIYRNDVIFVTPAGTGSGNNPDSPIKGGNAGELADAITYANNSSKKIVALAAGTYAVSSAQPNPALTLKEGISLYGGYSPSDWTRNIQSNESVIRDINVYTGAQGTILAGNTITNNTMLNRIVVETGRGVWAIGIYCNLSAGLKIINCAIRSRTDGTDTNTVQQFGIYLRNCGDVDIEGCNISLGEITASTNTYSVGIMTAIAGIVSINGNRIYAGRSKTDAAGSTYSYGINTNSITGIVALTITNNIISSGISENGISSGINLVTSPATSTYTIQNNTICSLNPFNVQNASCIYLATSAGSETIENNIFISSGASYSYCVFMNSAHAPDFLRNNLFYTHIASSTNRYIYSDGVTYNDLTTSIPSIGTNLLSLGNINENLAAYLADYDGPDNDILTLFDNDWHIVKSIHAPMNLLYGGVNLTASVTHDFDGIARTNADALKASNANAGGFTIGAFEKD